MLVVTATAVPSVAMEHVKQRAGEQQHEWQELHDVRPVLGPEEISCDQRKAYEYPSVPGHSFPDSSAMNAHTRDFAFPH
jgi:hypothetical protein